MAQPIEEYEGLCQECDTAVGCFLGACEKASARKPFEGFAGPLFTLLLVKLLRCHRAVRLLVSAGFAPEAATVVTTQFEVMLNIKYAAPDLRRVREWYEHTSQNRQPWTVRQMIEEVAESIPEEKKFLSIWFEHLCKLKHGNPTLGPECYPWERQGEGELVFLAEGERQVSATGKYLLAGSCICILEGLTVVCDLTRNREELEIWDANSLSLLRQKSKEAFSDSLAEAGI